MFLEKFKSNQIKKLTSSTIKRPKFGRFCIRKTFLNMQNCARIARNFLCYKKMPCISARHFFLCDILISVTELRLFFQ
jgi:hypothetical protein